MTHAYNPLMVLVYLLCHFLSQTNFFSPRLALIWHSAAWVFRHPTPTFSNSAAADFWQVPRAGCQASCWNRPHSSSRYLLPQDGGQRTEQHNCLSRIRVHVGLSSAKWKPVSLVSLVLITGLGTCLVLNK